MEKPSLCPISLDDDDRRNAELYRALWSEDADRVVALCQRLQDGPLHALTIHGSTVLHMAAFTMQDKLVTDLLEMLPQNKYDTLTHSNVVGNTILHEAAAFNELVPAANKMLEMAPQLLEQQNKLKETALFRAACYGKKHMFLTLEKHINTRFPREGDRRNFYQKDDKTSTILHAAIISGHFELSLHIAKKYKFLVDEKDKQGMTPLQHLARNPRAFQSRHSKYLRRLIDRFVSTARSQRRESQIAQGWRIPLLEAIGEEKRIYDNATELADFLIDKDKSWKNTHPVEDLPGKTNNSAGEPSLSCGNEALKKQKSAKGIPETPLFLAVRYGCVDIVKKILTLFPQAVTHVDGKGCTILHIAIQHRQMEIFDYVVKLGTTQIRELIQKCDRNRNSILHMVGEKRKYLKVQEDGEECEVEDLKQNPVLQLQEDWQLFERVEKMCSQYFFNHLNFNEKTAEELFAQNSENLRVAAKDWLKRTAENCSIIAVLITTVAFAAAYTIPGGSTEAGVPVLLNHPMFVIFTITDVLSLTSNLTSLVIFLSILTSPFRLEDFKNSLPGKLTVGLTLLIFSVSMMMLAFAATIILMISNKEQWTKIALYTVAFLPVTILAASYMPLYLSLAKTFKHMVDQIEPALPRYTGFRIAKLFNFHRTTPRSNPSKSTQV